jgi:CDP-glucose 4,6-dehydratase
MTATQTDTPPSRFWDGRRVLVTGATGLVGSWLVKDLLARGAHVIALVLDADPQSELFRSGDVNRVTVVNGPLEDPAVAERAVNRHEPATVFHLGAQTLVGPAHRHPVATFEANIRGTYHLLDACRAAGGLIEGVVVASSDKAYGESPELPYTEDMPLAGKHPYEVSKSCTDLLAGCYHHTYGLPVAVTRCGNVFGGGDLNWSRIVPDTVRRLLRGDRPVLRSDGTHVRDYVYVRDAARAYLRTAERLADPAVRGQAFNFSNEAPVSVLDLVRTIQRLMAATHLEPDVRNTAGGEIQSQYLSAAKARRVLRWKPEYDLEAGLRETIDWYRRYFATDRPEGRSHKKVSA